MLFVKVGKRLIICIFWVQQYNFNGSVEAIPRMLFFPPYFWITLYCHFDQSFTIHLIMCIPSHMFEGRCLSLQKCRKSTMQLKERDNRKSVVQENRTYLPSEVLSIKHLFDSCCIMFDLDVLVKWDFHSMLANGINLILILLQHILLGLWVTHIDRSCFSKFFLSLSIREYFYFYLDLKIRCEVF